MKRLLGVIFIAALFVPVLAQRSKPKLLTEGAPALRILSAPIKLDRAKRPVKLSLEVTNAGDKTIEAFSWEYRTQSAIRGYKVTTTAEEPEVSVVLPPGATKEVMLLEGLGVPEFLRSLPVREIRIISITFEDGSSWKRNKE
jgi:hypothetical protein